MPIHKFYKKNPLKYSKESNKYYYKNRDKILERVKLYRFNNPEKIKATNKRFYEKYKNDEEYMKKRRKERKKYRNTLLGKYKQYKNGAKGRQYSFDLTLKDFQVLWQKPCYYCGEPIESLGLDRKDNTKGYFTENIVPCCTRCNIMKKAMSSHEFIGHCLKISNHLKDNYVR